MADQPHFAGLDEDQLAAACQDTESPCIIVAGPGGGKTRTLCARILHILSLGVSPVDVVAITFTRKAASEMRERMQKLLPPNSRAPIIKTFHSFALSVLRMHTAELGFARPFKVTSGAQVFQLVRECVVAVVGEEHATRNHVSQFHAMVKSAKAHGHDASHLGDNARKVLQAYQDKLRFQCALDLADFVRVACDLLENNEGVRRRYQHKYLLVDEFQDANQQQLKLCQVITRQSGRLTVVGDVNQSIYAFRGASPTSNFGSLSRMGCRVIHLTTNYRSTAHIVESAEALIGHNSKRKDVPRIKAKGGRDGPKIHVVVCRSSVAEVQRLVAMIKEMPQEELNNSAVLCRTHAIVVELQAQLSRERVLHHTSSSQQHLAKLFDSSTGGACLSFVLALCTLAHSPTNTRALDTLLNVRKVIPKGVADQAKHILRTAPRGFTVEDALEQVLDQGQLKPATHKRVLNFVQTLCELRERARMCVLPPMVWLATHMRLRELEAADAPPPNPNPSASGEAGDDEADERAIDDDDGPADEGVEKGGAVEALVQQARLFDSGFNRAPGPEAGDMVVLRRFCEWLETRRGEHKRGVAANTRGVAVLTIHASKGLEWDTVFLPRFNEGVIPSAHALKSMAAGGDGSSGEGQVQEERRLAYVGITRSQRRCVITCALNDSAHSRPLVPSRFIDEIPSHCKETCKVDTSGGDEGEGEGEGQLGRSASKDSRHSNDDAFGLGLGFGFGFGFDDGGGGGGGGEGEGESEADLPGLVDCGFSVEFTTARKLISAGEEGRKEERKGGKGVAATQPTAPRRPSPSPSPSPIDVDAIDDDEEQLEPTPLGGRTNALRADGQGQGVPKAASLAKPWLARPRDGQATSANAVPRDGAVRQPVAGAAAGGGGGVKQQSQGASGGGQVQAKKVLRRPKLLTLSRRPTPPQPPPPQPPQQPQQCHNNNATRPVGPHEPSTQGAVSATAPPRPFVPQPPALAHPVGACGRRRRVPLEVVRRGSKGAGDKKGKEDGNSSVEGSENEDGAGAGASEVVVAVAAGEEGQGKRAGGKRVGGPLVGQFLPYKRSKVSPT